MSSFRQVLADHAPLLVLDACSARIQTGWLTADGAMRWASSDQEAGVGLFKTVESLGISPTDAGAYVFCEGPGSLLGIRTAAMAVRAWQSLVTKPAFSYRSLEVVAHAIGRPELNVIADARRDAWHCFAISTTLRRIPTVDLSGALAMPEGFRTWSELPPAVAMVPYSLEDILPRIRDVDLLRATDSPDAFLHEEPSYVTWTPRIHRAP